MFLNCLFLIFQIEESNRKHAELESKLNIANKRVCVLIVFKYYSVQQEKINVNYFFTRAFRSVTWKVAWNTIRWATLKSRTTLGKWLVGKRSLCLKPGAHYSFLLSKMSFEANVLTQEALVCGELFRVFCHPWLVAQIFNMLNIFCHEWQSPVLKEQAYNSGKRMRITDSIRKQNGRQSELVADAILEDAILE